MRSFPVLTLTLIATGLLASAQEPSKEAKIVRVLALMKAEALTDQVFEQMKAETASISAPNASEKERAHAREIQAKIMDLVKDRMSWEKMRPVYVKMYSETFTDEEIDAMLAFYQCPAGRAMLEKMPKLVAKIMALAQSQLAGLMPEIERLVKEPATN